jgi:hypothetical protein
MKSAELEPQHVLAGAFCWRASPAGGLQSSIGHPLAELPLAIGPLSIEPRLPLARHELGDDVRLVVIDAASIGLLAGLAGYDNEGNGAVDSAGICVNRQANNHDFFHCFRHCAPVRLSAGGRSLQFGRASAPAIRLAHKFKFSSLNGNLMVPAVGPHTCCS